MNTIDVLCVGDACYDLVFTVSRHPGEDEKSVAESLMSCGGGPAANAAVAVSRLGLRSAAAGYLGNDIYGDQHLDELEKDGVVTDFMVRGDRPTPLSVVLVKPDGKRALVNYRKPGQFLETGSIDFSTVDAKVILLDGHEPLVSSDLPSGVEIILDAGSVHRGTRELEGCVDYLVCSEKFARDFTGEGDEDRAAEKLASFAPNVVITLGERGLVWKNGHGRGRMPAFEIDAKDTTGAGDAFHGGFAACVARDMDWDYTLRYASAVAALNCTRTGARTGMPTGDEVEEFMKQHGHE